MKTAFVLFAVLALGLSNAAFASNCPSVPEYTTNLKLACEGVELYFLWPNYANVSEYYRCQGVANPVVVSCPVDTYFSYVLQTCQDCTNYIPSQACGTLKTENTPVCVPIDGSGGGQSGESGETPGSNEPTPLYPSTTPTTTPTTTTSTTTTSTTTTPTTTTSTTTTPTTTTSTTSTTTTTTTTVPPPTTTAFPPPPSPVTQDPNVPVPPTAAPTPPSIVNTPPSVVVPTNV